MRPVSKSQAVLTALSTWLTVGFGYSVALGLYFIIARREVETGSALLFGAVVLVLLYTLPAFLVLVVARLVGRWMNGLGPAWYVWEYLVVLVLVWCILFLGATNLPAIEQFVGLLAHLIVYAAGVWAARWVVKTSPSTRT